MLTVTVLPSTFYGLALLGAQGPGLVNVLSLLSE
jgi:hypothetical protein